MDIHVILHKIKDLYKTSPKFMREFDKDRKVAVAKEFGPDVAKALEKEFGNKKIDSSTKKKLDDSALDTIAGGKTKSNTTVMREREIMEENNRVLQEKKVIQKIGLDLDVDGNATIESQYI